jgi:hypothetical protein
MAGSSSGVVTPYLGSPSSASPTSSAPRDRGRGPPEHALRLPRRRCYSACFGNALVAAWWLDPVVGLLMAALAVKGGPRGLGERCCGSAPSRPTQGSAPGATTTAAPERIGHGPVLGASWVPKPRELPLNAGESHDGTSHENQRICRGYPRLAGKRRSVCHAEGRGFESLQPLSGKPPVRFVTSALDSCEGGPAPASPGASSKRPDFNAAAVGVAAVAVRTRGARSGR